VIGGEFLMTEMPEENTIKAKSPGNKDNHLVFVRA
jgi:hypothetical protein